MERPDQPAGALLAETSYLLNAGTSRTLKVTLAPQASEIIVFAGHEAYLPLVFKH